VVIELDVLVIGAGTAGTYAVNAAKRGAQKVGIVEKGQVGGDCVFHACIPTKALVHAARTYKKMRTADFFGLPVLEKAADYKNVKAFKDRIVSGLTPGRDKKLTDAGIQLFRGIARFNSPHEVAVGDEVIRAEKIIITTGSMPAVPPIPGLKEAGYITNIEALELEHVPQKLAVIGGGPIGIEFAQIFSSFGSRVHIYEAGERILAVEDEEVSGAATELFAKQGITVSAAVKISEVKAGKSGKALVTQIPGGQPQTEEFDELLVATGRKPNIDSLNLAAAGVPTTRQGITVDAFMHTGVPHIWAAGDAAGPPLFTYLAWPQGETAGTNAVQNKPREFKPDVLPRATFCDPEIASVGMTEQQAREKGFKIKIGRFNYADLTRSIIADEKDGFIKIVVDGDSGRILGAHILGAEASSLIHELAAAMSAGMTAKAVGDTVHSYPTYSEGVQYACQAIK
jgi:pyruvate/2-oxoglutarate dehydrogenase complex dihydrolipoamide dehydrogenase (E3) component